MCGAVHIGSPSDNPKEKLVMCRWGFVAAAFATCFALMSTFLLFMVVTSNLVSGSCRVEMATFFFLLIRASYLRKATLANVLKCFICLVLFACALGQCYGQTKELV